MGPVFRIRKTVLNEIRACGQEISLHEFGGILGGDGQIISEWAFDSGNPNAPPCCYEPDTDSLNRIIEEWSKRSVRFMGIFHSHLYDSGTLSAADRSYIRQIMEAVYPQEEKLFFPLLVMPEREMRPYAAWIDHGQVCLGEVPLLLIQDDSGTGSGIG